jgi:hypothetical protein
MDRRRFVTMMTGGMAPVYTRIMATSPLLYWTLEDAAGSTTALERTGKTGNICPNPSFEIPEASAVPFLGWSGGTTDTGVIAAETTDVHIAGTSAKVTAGAAGWRTTLRSPDLTVIPGVIYTVSAWVHGDGTNSPCYSVYDLTNSANIIGQTDFSVTGAVYSQKTFTFTAPAGCVSANVWMWQPTASTYALFDDIAITAPATANPHSLTLSGTGTTFGNAGIGDGKTAVALNGSGNLLGSAATLNALTDSTQLLTPLLTISLRVKVAAAFWDFNVPPATHNAAFSIYGNATNWVTLVHSTDDINNTYHNPFYVGANLPAGGIHNTDQDMSGAGGNWFSLICTVNQTTGIVNGYFNGVLGSTRPDAGRWNYVPLTLYLGSSFETWRQVGSLAHMTIWDRVLSDGEISVIGK